jgi:putative tryptophan/tyrosine transport system substrate-binding protein
MRRRDFISLLGGATAWPLVARAQQADRVRRIGALVAGAENNSSSSKALAGLAQGLSDLGWIVGRNLLLEIRWAAAKFDRMQMLAKELVHLRPDVILVDSTPGTAALQRETRTIPIVFAAISDPVGNGFVASLSRPGGNITGFIFTEAEMASKRLELLTEVAPSIKRVVIMFNPATAPVGSMRYLPEFEAAARSLKVEPIAAPIHSEAEIETVIRSLGREPAGGLVQMSDGGYLLAHRTPIMSLAAQNNVPAVYTQSVWAREGGLLTYGPDIVDINRRAAGYVDRILRGVKPAELPIQLPIKFEMVLNAKTAKALGLTIPPSILLRADEVIE